MAKGQCPRCQRRGDFLRQIDGIPNKVCCEACCRRFKTKEEKLYVGYHRIPEEITIKRFGCTTQDLTELNFTTVYYPVQKKERKLYLGAEAEWLGRERICAKYKMQRIAKRIQLERALGVQIRTMDPVLCAFMIGDYLKYPNKSKVTLEQIKTLFAVYKRAEKIKRSNPRSHPMAIFNFCIDYPNGTAADFRSLKSKTCRVFEIIGWKILQKLERSELPVLQDTPLNDVLDRFLTVERRGIIHSHLLEMVPSETAKHIMDHPACQLRIKRAYDERETSKKLVIFWRERMDSLSRMLRLLEALRRRRYYKYFFRIPHWMYISGEVDCDVEEIISLLELTTGNLREECRPKNFERLSIAASKLEEYSWTTDWDWKECAVQAARFANRVPLPKPPLVRGSFDYQHLTQGFWSKNWYAKVGSIDMFEILVMRINRHFLTGRRQDWQY